MNALTRPLSSPAAPVTMPMPTPPPSAGAMTGHSAAPPEHGQQRSRRRVRQARAERRDSRADGISRLMRNNARRTRRRVPWVHQVRRHAVRPRAGDPTLQGCRAREDPPFLATEARRARKPDYVRDDELGQRVPTPAGGALAP